MIRWNGEPLWWLFPDVRPKVPWREAPEVGAFVRWARPLLEVGTDPAVRPPRQPLTPHTRWQHRKALERAGRYLEKAEQRPGASGRWALGKAKEYLARARAIAT